jgi:Retrotransposon gag protein
MPTTKGKSREPTTSAEESTPATGSATPKDQEIEQLREEMTEMRASFETSLQELKDAILSGSSQRTLRREQSDVSMQEIEEDDSQGRADDREPREDSESEFRQHKRSRRTSSQESNRSATSPHSSKELTKHLMQLIPKYDGSGDAQSLMEFIEAFEEYIEYDKMSPEDELALAVGKLGGDAKIWWRDHRMTTANDESKQITYWEALKKALVETYAPPENSDAIRDKLRNLRQTGTVKEYNAAFRRLTMQLTDLYYPEARYTYLYGLSPRLRELIKTKEGISDIRSLQNACLSLETDKSRERTMRYGEAHSATSSSPPSSTVKPSKSLPKWLKNAPCPICDKKGHRTRHCPKLKDLKSSTSSTSAGTTTPSAGHASFAMSNTSS